MTNFITKEIDRFIFVIRTRPIVMAFSRYHFSSIPLFAIKYALHRSTEKFITTSHSYNANNVLAHTEYAILSSNAQQY